MNKLKLVYMLIVLSLFCLSCQTNSVENNIVTKSSEDNGDGEYYLDDSEFESDMTDMTEDVLTDIEKAACREYVGQRQTIFSTFYEIGEALPLTQLIKTKDYEIMVPSGWEIPVYAYNNPHLQFYTKEGEIKEKHIDEPFESNFIGRIETLSYEPNVIGTYPPYNLDVSATEAYCELIEDSQLPGSFIRYSLLEVMDLEKAEPVSQYAQIEFFVSEKMIIYKLHFFTDRVSKATVFDIVKSFKIAPIEEKNISS